MLLRTMKRRLTWPLALILVVASTSSSAQLIGKKTTAGCISVGKGGATVIATGRLTLRHMTGPPDFESIKHGDQDRPTLILVLPTLACIDDGGDFADPNTRFRTVHVWSVDPVVHRRLRDAIGKTVTIRGEGYAQDNAFHYAPLVLEAKLVTAH